MRYTGIPQKTAATKTPCDDCNITIVCDFQYLYTQRHTNDLSNDTDCDVPTDDFVGRGFARLCGLAGLTRTLYSLLREILL
jgi:hypothetical protein